MQFSIHQHLFPRIPAYLYTYIPSFMYSSLPASLPTSSVLVFLGSYSVLSMAKLNTEH